MRLRALTILAALAVLPATLPASAEGYYGHAPYGGYRSYGAGVPRVAYGQGFAQPFIEGDYIGAPFTKIPRPNDLVPAPWSYGTYGVPTVSGIARPPTGQPTLTVIHAPRAGIASRRSAAPPDEEQADLRVVNVTVPRR
ncbi:hypothetical protein [Methylobacterium sp. J-076]|uniref:hypothetical protein n=1 Tax=Methylobacterium sp. J-076 TaxID=2836655 RepID=UPI001FB9DF4B|nr:hypothetical protein [Methylobacterium sp. J-076]MCJ2015419.1 hypothetical protein [Methylobacterium sp. J-076]